MLICCNSCDCWRLIAGIACRESRLYPYLPRVEGISRYECGGKSGYDIVGGDQGWFIAKVILCKAEVSRKGRAPGWLEASEYLGGKVFRKKSSFWNSSKVMKAFGCLDMWLYPARIKFWPLQMRLRSSTFRSLWERNGRARMVKDSFVP